MNGCVNRTVNGMVNRMGERMYERDGEHDYMRDEVNFDGKLGRYMYQEEGSRHN